MLLGDFIRKGTEALSSLYPPEEARSIVYLLCEGRLGTKRHAHLVEPALEVPADRLPLLLDDLDRLRTGEPVQYVLGTACFCGRPFRVTPSVLIPRPETELLCREACRVARCRGTARPVRILDLCTGSGCIAWTLAAEVPGAVVVGTDLSQEALDVAACQPFPLPNPPQFVRSDVLDLAQPFPQDPFDILLSNPPYVRESERALMRPNVLSFEPSTALFVPDGDPLVFYRALVRWAERLLVPDGWGMVEINEAFGPAVADLFRAAGLRYVEIVPDFYQKDRFITFIK